MKKTYIIPNINVVILKMTQQLLSGSGVETGGTPGKEYTPGDVSYSREFDWDEE